MTHDLVKFVVEENFLEFSEKFDAILKERVLELLEAKKSMKEDDDMDDEDEDEDDSDEEDEDDDE